MPNGFVNVEPVVMAPESYKKLENNILMFYLGGTHSASEILKEQSQNVKALDKAAVQNKMCDLTRELKAELQNNNVDAMGELLHKNWMLKPLRISVALAMPDIKNDKRILDAMSLHFNSYNLFEEMMNLEIMQKRIDFIGTFKDSLTETDAEGNETPFFSLKFLVMQYLKMSDADLELNEKYKLEAELAKKSGEKKKDDEGDEDKEGEEGEEDNGSESDESDDIDSEMLGDVQPESSETAQL